MKIETADWMTEVLVDWKHYIGLILPLALSRISEEASFEVNTMLAGGFQNPIYLAAHVAIASSETLLYTIDEGFSIILNTFVGRAMGEAKIKKSQRQSVIGMGVAYFAFICI